MAFHLYIQFLVLGNGVNKSLFEKTIINYDNFKKISLSHPQTFSFLENNTLATQMMQRKKKDGCPTMSTHAKLFTSSAVCLSDPGFPSVVSRVLPVNEEKVHEK